ncbi:MAG: hypothetical protein SWJ54_16505, partial [Cyanobacteriota bacterium]|nr:hypothetical protein [Cyanobacteriota bacterium]
MLINAKATNLEEISELSQGQYTDDDYLRNIKKLDTSLADYYSEKFLVDNSLTRKVVSFQANKERA